ncbi:hypothetical protein HPB48_019248 [Haemaphysalis longicornis]|uniref:Fucosyltransferase n=1 Tax=Haemaphysalis longicornis TaxID=44386 RepID=A0A9J6GPS1_HAELO|nr:hypothetical protein HPB48_019248 [Haemaphysalis longicornis]
MADEHPDDEGGNAGEEIPLHDMDYERVRARRERRVHFILPQEHRRHDRRLLIVVVTAIVLIALVLTIYLCYTVDFQREVKQTWHRLFNPDEEVHPKIRIPKTVLPLDPVHWRHRASDHGMPRILLWNPHVEKSGRSITVAPDMDDGKGPRSTIQVSDCAAISRRGVSERCEVAQNRDLLKHSDAVVFNGDRFNAYDLPPERIVDQVWVFWTKMALIPYDYRKESSLGNREVNALFNWTMAYWDDADVRFPRQIWRYRLSPVSSSATEPISYLSPRQSAALIVGTCNRDHIIDHLAAFSSSNARGEGTVAAGLFNLHALLECASAVCKSLKDCVAHVAARYHFILVFKSSDCFTSVYDVIFEAFKYDLVPVFLGPPDVTLDVPPHSIVSSGTLEPSVPLSSHLQSILDDPRQYESFFSWKKGRVDSRLARRNVPPVLRALGKESA